MTRLAHRVGRRTTWLVLSVALAVAGVPAHGLASAECARAAWIAPAPVSQREVRASSARCVPRRDAASGSRARRPSAPRPRRTAEIGVARGDEAPRTPRFIAHRALLR